MATILYIRNLNDQNRNLNKDKNLLHGSKNCFCKNLTTVQITRLNLTSLKMGEQGVASSHVSHGPESSLDTVNPRIHTSIYKTGNRPTLTFVLRQPRQPDLGDMTVPYRGHP